MCEASASCESFQLAICLHCNLRLCLLHINEHNQSIYDRVQNACVEVESASLYVQETFREHRTTLVQAVTAVEEWRQKQIEEIEQNYLNEMQSLQLKQSMLDNTQEILLNQLERDARQVLDKMAWQQNANLNILHAVQHTIETVRHEAVQSIESYSVKPMAAEGILWITVGAVFHSVSLFQSTGRRQRRSLPFLQTIRTMLVQLSALLLSSIRQHRFNEQKRTSILSFE